ncbi:ferredoxin oxidoreductase [Desulfolucanica intricata]|uniref:ferredoxin oxidoreductase n=1 Tax=Desulfolucanica intricata TaxID=1285191 RepID=UPI00082C6841|nr:ferredoxin oxidoreductase [Desulfolucanica intricata]
MPDKPIQGEKRVFMTGNEVVAWAALAAKAEIMYGYPITPQNEIMHYWTRLAPKYERRFLQTEDELSAGFTTVGGVLAGRKAFTATAGPGNTLMQEPLSMAEAMRLPTVVVVTQRGGPSTATVIYSQQEVTMTTQGGNGEGLRIVYSPATHQELFDYTIKAFNTAWTYRWPTFVLGDGYQAKLREPLTIYDPEEKGIELVPAEPYLGKPGMPGIDRPPTHVRNTYSVEEELAEVLEEYFKEYNRIATEVAEYKAMYIDDADIVVVAHGVVARAAKMAVEELRKEGLKVGYFRPVTLMPMPVEAVKDVANKAKKLLIVESAQGQLDKLMKISAYGCTTEFDSLFKPGVGITSEDIYARVKELL